jgi:hypothetical protein
MLAISRTVRVTFVPVLPVLVSLFILSGCGGTTQGGSVAELRVSATDTPLTSSMTAGGTAVPDDPTTMFASVEVVIPRIYLVPDEGEAEVEKEGDAIELLDEPPLVLDLVHLEGGAPQIMAETTIPAGTYSQLRVIVTEATVTLAEGYSFAGGESEHALTVPSGAQTGIKVGLHGPIEANPDSWSSLLVDFDVAGNFVVHWEQGSETVVRDVLFKPVLNEASRTALSPNEPEQEG